MKAMLEMTKIDVAELQAATAGRPGVTDRVSGRSRSALDDSG